MAYDTSIRRLPDPYYGGGVGFSSASLSPVSTGTSNPLNGGGVVSSIFQGGYWEIDISYPDTLQHELRTIIPFLDSLEGSFNSFYIMLPQHRYPYSGPWDESTAVKRAQGDIELVSPKRIRIPDWSTRGGDLVIGDMVKFTNSSKVYRVTFRDDNPDGSVTLELNTPVKYPSLLAVAGFELNELLFKVIIKGNSTPKPRLQPNGIYSGFSLSLRENNKED